jgi:hypothetical protein
MVKPLNAATLLLAATAAAHAAEPQSEATPMSFEKCLATIRGTAAELGIAPINIVETNDVRMVAFLRDERLGSGHVQPARQQARGHGQPALVRVIARLAQSRQTGQASDDNG